MTMRHGMRSALRGAMREPYARYGRTDALTKNVLTRDEASPKSTRATSEAR